MAPFFLERGYTVTGLDSGFFEDCLFMKDPRPIPTIRKDLRDVTADDLEGFDAIIHLAAICNDPLGNLNSGWTHEINHTATTHLARLAKAQGVRRFLFSSSCSMHGASQEAAVTEETPVHPLTPYGQAKIRAEEELNQMKDKNFTPVFLRNGTVYGVSPRLRLDIVLNNLVGWAATTGRIRILSDGTPWRPVIHVEDVCRAFEATLEASESVVSGEAFHVGSNDQNFRIRELAEIVRSVIPHCQVELVQEKSADQRTYIADFSKIEKKLPAFRPQWTAATGTEQLYRAFREQRLTEDQMNGDRYIRLNRIQRLLNSSRLDSALRWAKQ